jgi:glucosamine-phosphate N-acetyltransferase
MILRKLEINDYYLGLNNLLSQLTNSNEISFDTFVKQYLKLGNNYNIYVIEINNKIVGYGCLYIDYKFYRNCANVGHIEDIIVDKEYRSNGYSKLIINKLIEISKENNCYKTILLCDRQYIDFYKNFGFDIIGYNMVLYY